MKSAVRFFVLAVLLLWTAPVFADCGIDHSNADAQTLMDAAMALEAANPDLAAKVKAVAIKHFPEKKEMAMAKEHGGKEQKEHAGS